MPACLFIADVAWHYRVFAKALNRLRVENQKSSSLMASTAFALTVLHNALVQIHSIGEVGPNPPAGVFLPHTDRQIVPAATDADTPLERLVSGIDRPVISSPYGPVFSFSIKVEVSVICSNACIYVVTGVKVPPSFGRPVPTVPSAGIRIPPHDRNPERRRVVVLEAKLHRRLTPSRAQ